MRRATGVVVLLVSGCAGLPFPAMTPTAIQPQDRTYQHEIDYEVMTQIERKSCASDEELKALKGPRHLDPATVGHPALFERAKFEAIAGIKGCDALVSISAKVEYVNSQQCVSVQGRGLKVRGVRAIGAGVRQPFSGATPRRTDDESEPVGSGR